MFWHHGSPVHTSIGVPDPATTEGRYHRRGEAGAWYASGTEAAMWREFDGHFDGDAVDRRYVLRRAGSFAVDVEALDLTDDDVLDALDLTTKDLVTDDLALPQLVAAASRAAGFSALLVPSAAVEGAVSLVVFGNGIVGVEELDVAVQAPQ